MIFRLNKDNLSAALHEVAVAIDSQKYNKKPTGGEIGAIRNRLSGRNAHAALTIEQIADKIAHGYTIARTRTPTSVLFSSNYLQLILTTIQK